MKIVIESDCMPMMWKPWEKPGDGAFMFAEIHEISDEEYRKLKAESRPIEEGWWLVNDHA